MKRHPLCCLRPHSQAALLAGRCLPEARVPVYGTLNASKQVAAHMDAACSRHRLVASLHSSLHLVGGDMYIISSTAAQV